MNPDRDRAERFDRAYEARRDGRLEPELDNDEADLLDLAARLEQDLPEDLPDPGFRQRLRDELLGADAAAPVNQGDGDSSDTLTEFEQSRWRRFRTTTPWRFGAAAAAVVIVIIASIVFILDDGDETESTTNDSSTQALRQGDGDDSSSDGLDETTDEPGPLASTESIENGATGEENEESESAEETGEVVASATLPPFDSRHVVISPMLAIGGGSQGEPEVSTIEWMPVNDLPDVPESAMVYYLTAPPDPYELLQNLQDELDINGEIEHGDSERGRPYRIVDDQGEMIVEWSPNAAFLRYHNPAEPATSTADPLDPERARELADDWLRMINFDLSSPAYEREVEPLGNSTIVRYIPTNIPSTNMDMHFGIEVTLDAGGTVRHAAGFWLSLTEWTEIDLHESEEAWEMAQDGEGYWPPLTEPYGEVQIEVDDADLTYLLTRQDDLTYVLQPAIELVGNMANSEFQTLDSNMRCYVPASRNRD